MFIETMLGSILTAAAICLKKHHPDLALILRTILLIAANLGTFWMNANRLGYLESQHETHSPGYLGHDRPWVPNEIGARWEFLDSRKVASRCAHLLRV